MLKDFIFWGRLAAFVITCISQATHFCNISTFITSILKYCQLVYIKIVFNRFDALLTLKQLWLHACNFNISRLFCACNFLLQNLKMTELKATSVDLFWRESWTTKRVWLCPTRSDTKWQTRKHCALRRNSELRSNCKPCRPMLLPLNAPCFALRWRSTYCQD